MFRVYVLCSSRGTLLTVLWRRFVFPDSKNSSTKISTGCALCLQESTNPLKVSMTIQCLLSLAELSAIGLPLCILCRAPGTRLLRPRKKLRLYHLSLTIPNHRLLCTAWPATKFTCTWCWLQNWAFRSPEPRDTGLANERRKTLTPFVEEPGPA